MNKRFSKALVISLALALVIGATLAFVSSAETKPEIISNNVEYGEKFSLMYAVDAATVAEGPVTLTIYAEAPAEGVKALATYTAKAPETIKIQGVETSAYVFTTAGVAPKDLGDIFYAQATDAKGKTSDAVKYSVTEYMLERLYGGATITAAQEKMYKKSLEFGIAAQKLLSPDDEIKISDYSYVRVVGGTANGAEKGMYLNGTTLALSANDSYWQATFADGTAEKIDGLTYTVNGSALIETYKKPPELATSYYTTQTAAGEKTFDYNTLGYSDLNADGTNAYKFLIRESEYMSTWERSHTWLDQKVRDDADSTNKVLAIGKDHGNARNAALYFYNINDTSKNCVVFETEIKFYMVGGSAYLTDTTGRSAFWFGFVNTDMSSRSPDATDLAVAAEISGPCQGGGFTSLKFNDQTIENNVWYRLTVEYYKAEGVVNYYIDGYLVKTAEADKNLTMANAKVILNGAASGCRVYFDNTYCASLK